MLTSAKWLRSKVAGNEFLCFKPIEFEGFKLVEFDQFLEIEEDHLVGVNEMIEIEKAVMQKER